MPTERPKHEGYERKVTSLQIKVVLLFLEAIKPVWREGKMNPVLCSLTKKNILYLFPLPLVEQGSVILLGDSGHLGLC